MIFYPYHNLPFQAAVCLNQDSFFLLNHWFDYMSITWYVRVGKRAGKSKQNYFLNFGVDGLKSGNIRIKFACRHYLNFQIIGVSYVCIDTFYDIDTNICQTKQDCLNLQQHFRTLRKGHTYSQEDLEHKMNNSITKSIIK